MSSVWITNHPRKRQNKVIMEYVNCGDVLLLWNWAQKNKKNKKFTQLDYERNISLDSRIFQLSYLLFIYEVTSLFRLHLIHDAVVYARCSRYKGSFKKIRRSLRTFSRQFCFCSQIRKGAPYFLGTPGCTEKNSRAGMIQTKILSHLKSRNLGGNLWIMKLNVSSAPQRLLWWSWIPHGSVAWTS